MKVGIAYDAFTHSFKHYFPDIEVIRRYSDVKNYDLIIFSGGEDINPSIYGNRNLYSRGINPERDDTERSILIVALDIGKKILGVCRGHQLINAVRGGKLLQDIYIQSKAFHEGFHPLEVTYPNSITGSSFTEVNSLHHQGVINSGAGLKATSYYKKIIESTESQNIISVQFHPEFMVDKQADLFFDKIYRWVKNDKEFSDGLKTSAKSEDISRKESLDSYMRSVRTEIGTWSYNTTNIRVEEFGQSLNQPEVYEDEEPE